MANILDADGRVITLYLSFNASFAIDRFVSLSSTTKMVFCMAARLLTQIRSSPAASP
jgi:hypothetical protein